MIASLTEIAAAVGVHRNTVGRLTGLFDEQGMSAVVSAKRGPKGPHKVTPEVYRVVAANSALPLNALCAPWWRSGQGHGCRAAISIECARSCGPSTGDG